MAEQRWPPRELAGRYVLGRSLGQGGMGGVWEAVDSSLGRAVAIKLIRLDRSAGDDAQQRFAREARAAAALSHTNIVTVHDFGVDDGVAFMVMERLAGPDLAALVRSHGPLPVATALDYARQAAAGLAAAHARGIVHRDVKPANLMLDGHGVVKLVDFGIASTEDTGQLTGTGQLIGTLTYLAPERSLGVAASAHSDLYSLGCALTALLVGRPPFRGESGRVLWQHINQTPPSVRSQRAEVPAEVDVLLARLLAKDPADRPGSASEVAAELAHLGALLPVLDDTPRIVADVGDDPTRVTAAHTELARQASAQRDQPASTAGTAHDSGPADLAATVQRAAAPSDDPAASAAPESWDDPGPSADAPTRGRPRTRRLVVAAALAVMIAAVLVVNPFRSPVRAGAVPSLRVTATGVSGEALARVTATSEASDQVSLQVQRGELSPSEVPVTGLAVGRDVEVPLTGLTNGQTYVVTIRSCVTSGPCTSGQPVTVTPVGPVQTPTLTVTVEGQVAHIEAAADGAGGATVLTVTSSKTGTSWTDQGDGSLSIAAEETLGAGATSTYTVTASTDVVVGDRVASVAGAKQQASTSGRGAKATYAWGAPVAHPCSGGNQCTFDYVLTLRNWTPNSQVECTPGLSSSGSLITVTIPVDGSGNFGPAATGKIAVYGRDGKGITIGKHGFLCQQA